MAETLPQVVVETDPFMDINMERFRLYGIIGKERDMEQQINRKPERNWRTIIFSSIWYIVFVMLILTTLVGLSILAIRLGREGHIEVVVEEVKHENSSDAA